MRGLGASFPREIFYDRSMSGGRRTFMIANWHIQISFCDCQVGPLHGSFQTAFASEVTFVVYNVHEAEDTLGAPHEAARGQSYSCCYPATCIIFGNKEARDLSVVSNAGSATSLSHIF